MNKSADLGGLEELCDKNGKPIVSESNMRKYKPKN